MKTPSLKKIVLWSLLLCAIYGMALLRPIHQDDGWYASFALRYLDQLGLLHNASIFSIGESFGGRESPFGFVFAAAQTFFYGLLGFTLQVTRLFNAVAILGVVFIVYKFAERELFIHRWWLTLAFLIHPVVYYHFYNRPEILAVLFALLSIYILLYKTSDKRLVFFSFFIWAFILDTHPIAIFLVIGIGSMYWARNISNTWLILAGGLSGLILKMTINQLINGNIGLFAGLIGQAPLDFGDHYAPVLKSDFNDFLKIFLERFDTIKSFMVYSGLFILVPYVLIKGKRSEFLSHPLTINYIVFIILSTLGTEASGNGFALYHIAHLFLMYILVLRFCPFIQSKKHSWIIFALLMAMSIKSTSGTMWRYYKYSLSFQNEYTEFVNCMPPNAKYLMRPTFVFDNHEKNIRSDAGFTILMLMQSRNIGFFEAIKYRNYDYVAIDEMHLNGEFIIDKRSDGAFSNPFFSKFKDIGITQKDFEDLISTGKLKPVCEFYEISHGQTVLYKVNKTN
jgi:hypothetical protein